MTGYDDERLDDLDARLHRDDPRFAGAMASGRAHPPREYRRARAGALLAIACVALVVGIALGHGLLVAAGLVLAGIAGDLCAPHFRRPRRPGPPSRW